MKVLYFIFSNGKASGGHYHSLDQVSKEYGARKMAGIITIGNSESPVLVNNPNYIKHLSYNGFSSLFLLNSEIKKVINVFNPDVLHFFDTESMNILLLLPCSFSLPIVLNKCGGPNPMRTKWQYADATVVFSLENYNWFKKNKNYDISRIKLIPNRVRKLEYVPKEERTEKKDYSKITFMRISRLGGAYDKTLMDSFNLIEDLSKKYPVEFIVVGRIQDESLFLELKEIGASKNINLRYINDERASKGSQFLYLADFVIGTGRSFMEAVSLGIPTLVPAANADRPILVTEGNFANFFAANFSERSIVDKNSLNLNSKKLITLIENKSAYQKSKVLMMELFNKNFGTDQIYKKYDKVYSWAIKNRTSKFYILKSNAPYLIKNIMP
jgi:glycosyltransferase involved in cell wall biosynthesis